MSLDSEDVFRAQQALAAKVRQTSARAWDAETADEAAAFLRCRFYWPSALATGDSESGFRGTQRVFFRGHADARWSPRPTLLRLKPDEAEREVRVTRLGAAVFDVHFRGLWSADGAQAWPPFSEHSGMAAAQHYGFYTKLLDWTSNPTVAVHFATSSKSSETSPKACVLWLDVETAARLGLKLVLPPMFVTRLYMQRGIFAEVTEDLVDQIEATCSRITFPAKPRFPIHFTPDGVNLVEGDVLPNEPWFEDLKTWARANVDDAELSSDPGRAHFAFTMRHGNHPAMRQFDPITAMFQADEHAEAIMGIVNDLASRWHGDSRVYDASVIRLLERDNGPLVGWLKAAGLLPH